MKGSRQSYRAGATISAAIYGAGIFCGATIVASLGFSTKSIAIACAIMTVSAVLAETMAWRTVALRVRRLESVARRTRRVAFVAAAGAQTMLMAALNDPAGLLETFGAAAPLIVRLLVLIRLDPAALDQGAKLFASFAIGAGVAVVLAIVLVRQFWRYASAAERARLHAGPHWIRMQDFIGLFAIPLFIVAMFTVGLATAWWVWQLAVMAFALLAIVVFADAPLLIAAYSPMPKRAVRDDEKAARRTSLALLFGGFLAASVLGNIAWTGLGRTSASAAAGLLAIGLALTAVSALFWYQTRPLASIEQRRPINRPEWISQLFAISFFIIPMSWARDAPMFQVKRIEDVLISPRFALMLVAAAVAVGILHLLGGWLQRVEAREVAQGAASA